MQAQVLLFNKPVKVLSQFSQGNNNKNSHETQARKGCLADYIDLPDYYAAGRLDFDSEGLLILTNSGKLQARITEPKHKLGKSYWVQVTGTPSDEAIASLRQGVLLKDGMTAPAKIQRIEKPSTLWARQHELPAFRENNSSWLEVTLSEGKNRQVRRMLASLSHPVLRLVRHQVGPWKLHNLQPGEYCLETINLPKEQNHQKP